MTTAGIDNVFIIPLPNNTLDFHWPDINVHMVIKRISENGRYRAIHGEVTVSTPETHPILTDVNVCLTDYKDRQSFIFNLVKLMPVRFGQPWDDIVNGAFSTAIEWYRKGEQVVKIRDIATDTKIFYRLHPLIPEKQLSLIYGKGGGGKSTLACLFAVLIQDCIADINLTPTPGNVLYLDYEQDRSVIAKRINAIRRGIGEPPDSEDDILYRRCNLPLAEDAPNIRELIDQHSIAAVIIDGFGYAIGGDTQKEDRVIQTANAIRSLDITAIAIDHESKTSDGETPFGSIYKYNAARSIFYLKSSQDENTLQIALIHKKMNDGRLLSPLAYEFTYQVNQDNPEIIDKILTRVINPENVPGLSDSMPQWLKIKELLLTDGAMTMRDIADTTGIPYDHVKAYLNRYDKIFIKLEYKKWGIRTNV